MSRRTYVDNAQNRSLGRVGLQLGTAVHSRSSGSMQQSFSSTCAPRTYVDNSQNRSLGRVGLPLGTAVHSRSSGGSMQQSSSSTCAPRTYVDNSQNRSLGRVGLPLGTAVHSRSSGGSMQQSSMNQLMSSPSRTYVDNAYNRRLGRVGLPLGSAVHSRSSSTIVQSTVSTSGKTYVDNAYNRKLGRVGLPLGSALVSRKQTNKNLENLRNLVTDIDGQAHNEESLWEHLSNARDRASNNEDALNCDQVEEIFNRRDAAKVRKARSVKPAIKFDGHIIHFDELELGDKIGSGGFADVHVAMWKRDHQVAVKKLRVQRVSKVKKTEFENEAQLLSALKHPAIITLYGACIETPNLALVMEFMPKGSLHDLLVESTQLSDKQKKSLIQDALSALDYIHERKISHRDIKSRNILVCENLTNCKLSDFGLALKDYCQTSSSVTSVTTHQFVGTIKYSPPEVLSGNRLNSEDLMAADIYAMALTIVELISEEEPFDGLNQNQIRRAVLAGETPSIGDVPVDLRHVIAKCLGAARHRPSASVFLGNFLKVKDDLWYENVD